MSFKDHLLKRRTIYSIGKNVALDEAKIEEIIKEAVRLSPSSFNSQTSRVVILFGESHAKFWEIVRETLHKMVPAENFASTDSKISSFAAVSYTHLRAHET